MFGVHAARQGRDVGAKRPSNRNALKHKEQTNKHIGKLLCQMGYSCEEVVHTFNVMVVMLN